jgi:anaerobic magnesium-protoporphyrin IX monomethyl ester cyclase
MPKTRILFLNPPSVSRFDAAGARFQARRKANTMWYPSWLAYAAGVSKKEFTTDLIDCPAEGMRLPTLIKKLMEIKPGIIAIYTSTPSLPNDIKVCHEIIEHLPDAKTIFVGPHVTVLPEHTLNLSRAIWGIARGEFEYTILELARAVEQKQNYKEILGLSWRDEDHIVQNPARPLLENLDEIPFVTPIYKEYLNLPKYYLSFALHPYVPIYTIRGCPSMCTFCLWPQTISGHKLRMRTPENVVAELEYIERAMPEVKEVLFDDDTFTADRRRVHQICDLIIAHGIKLTWSANARANVDLETLEKMKKAGARLLMIGYESGSDEILRTVKKGVSTGQMKAFSQDAKRAGLMLHGGFIIGLPGETSETIKQTVAFAKNLRLDSGQFSVATPLPGTEFYEWCRQQGIIAENTYLNLLSMDNMLDESGYQSCVLKYPGLSAREITEAVDHATVAFYWRPRFLLTMLKHSFKGPRELERLFLGGPSFVSYCLKRWWRRIVHRSHVNLAGKAVQP